MKARNKWLASILCLLMVVLLAVGLTACGGKCEHQWSEWSATKAATCTEAGIQERRCGECGEIETSTIEALGHSWNEATCSMPKTCKNCAATEGQPLAHAYTQEMVKAEALKSEATCTSAAVYYKSCACGAVSTNDADTFNNGEPSAHSFAVETVKAETLKSEATCTSAAVYYKSCVCGAVSTNDADTFENGEPAAHSFTEETVKSEALKSEATCTGAAVYYKSCVCGAVSTNDVDTFESGTPTAHSFTLKTVKPEALKSAATTTSAAVYYKSCVCGAVSTSNADTFTSGAPIGHTHSYTVQSVKPEAEKTSATCTSPAVYYKSCACGAISTNDEHTFTSGAALDHKDENKDHICDNGCGKADMGTHADSDTDADHVCDYGCGVMLNQCADASGDGNHDCDVCGNADVTGHAYSEATCGVPSTCSECGATTGETLSHSDVNKDHVCDNGCGKMDVGNHADSAEDDDHLCDYGCKVVLEACSDVETDDNHNCDVCGKENVSAHNYEETSSTEATCVAAATKTYLCNCSHTYTDNVGDALGHDITGVTAVEKQVGGCEHVLVYTCKRTNCGTEVTGETVYHHSYVASITIAATCKADGEKTLTCACGASKTEKIDMNATGHDWQNGEIQNGVRTDCCALCEETKTVTVYEGTNTGSVNAADLAEKEIELNGANISLDSGVIESLGDQSVTVSADKFDGDLGLTDEQLDQVGDSPIYDFKISGENGSVSEFGENSWVTITLPYQLSKDEDVDSIAVWFISNQCENEECTNEECADPAHKLVSIKATYNNGYVTFKTNHFSYYTVTNLTPAERCALYGHGYAEQKVDGSCTTDAYTLYVCVRCHDKYVDNVVPAPGHKYEEVLVPATCMQDGSATYTCACGHSYSTKLNATGHVFEVEETVPATCVADGYTKYGCTNCDEEYSVVAAKLAHEYTDTVFAVTCTADGYTLHDCDNCDYSYKDAYVKATGHNYQSDAWAWAADHSAATLTFVCQNDATHKTVLNATMASETVNHVCTGYIKTTYTATVSFNETEYTDVKVVEVGSPEHSYSFEWTKNEDSHWRECLCGEKTDVAKHAFENAETTKAPTCVEPGESTATCVCGETKVTAIAATGEHSYVNGSCTTCGKRETDCDHTELTEKTLDFGELGGCEGTLYYYSCECGQVKLIDEERTNVSWEMEVIEEDQYEDENGNQWYTVHGVCTLCGLEVQYRATKMKDGCMVKVEAWYTFIVNGVTVFENGCFEDTNAYHENSVEAKIDLVEYGACGGSLWIYQCTDCGEIINVYEWELSCDIDDRDVTEEEVTDENGVRHLMQRATCPDCGLTAVIDAREMENNVCVQRWFVTTNITIGEHSFEGTYGTEQGSHSYEYTYELVGENCEDDRAIQVTMHCSVCGETSTGWTSGHQYEYKVLNLADQGKCESDIRYHACVLCGEVAFIDWADISCDVEDDTQSEYTDEDGNIHTVRTGICPDCGLTLMVDQWYVVESVCETVPHMVIAVYDGETLIFEGPVSVPYTTKHQWQTSYEMFGESCEDGYQVTMYCDVCGETSTYNSWGHELRENGVELAEYGFCGGAVWEEYCTICETVFNVQAEYGCQFQYQGETDDGYFIFHCEDCGGTVLQRQQQGEKDDHCWIEMTVNNIYLINGEEVYRCEYNHSQVSHNYSYEFEMYGESCLDGYAVAKTCKDCGATETLTYYSHIIFQTFELGEEDNCCAEHAVQYGSCPCGYGDVFQFDAETFAYNEEMRRYECEKCDLVIVSDEQWGADGCYETQVSVHAIILADKEIYRNEQEIRFDSHDFATTEVSLVDGLICLSAKCTNCGMTTAAQIQQVTLEDHDGQNYYDYTFTPSTTGTYTIVGLSSEDTAVELYHLLNDELVLLNQDDDSGNQWNFCLTAELMAGETYVYRIKCWGKEGTVCFSLDQGTDGACNHSWSGSSEFSVLPEGAESCEDGVLSGVIYGCGCIGQMRLEYRHITSIRESIDLTQYGACSGRYVISASCPCGKESDSYYTNVCFDSRNHDSYKDDEGRWINVEIQSCSKCGVQLKKSSYTEEIPETCTATEYSTIAIIDKAGNTVFEQSLTRIVEIHDTQVISATLMDGAKNCEDGVKLIWKCRNCEYTTTGRTYGHTCVAQEYIDLTQYGACSGRYVISASCACGQVSEGNYYDDVCFDSREYDDYKNDEGRWINVEIQSCSKCGVQLKKSNYTEEIPETCTATEYSTIAIFDKAGNTVFEQSLTQIVEIHDTQVISATLMDGAKTCEDGVNLIWKCRNCEYTTTGRTYGHRVWDKEYIDLTKYGVCSGESILRACACGQENRYEVVNLCGSWTENRYQDQDGKWIKVETCACETCSLRYTLSWYAVPMEESCMETRYCTINITVANQLIVDLEYSEVREAHDYQTTGSLLEGAQSCEEGVQITNRCKNCGNQHSYTEYHHMRLPQETIDLSQYGSSCGGQAVLYTCVCGQYSDLSLDTNCDLSKTSCELWIDAAVTDKSQPAVDGWYSYEYSAYVHTCSVTDPAACNCKIRYARYWLKDEDSCTVSRYETWQFGYNEETGECLYELTFKSGNSRRYYHAYTVTQEDNGTKYDCPDCGSYYYEHHYYDDNGWIKTETKAYNALNDGNIKYSERVEQPYVGPFGDAGVQVINTKILDDGTIRKEEHAVVQITYGEYRVDYIIYETWSEGDAWERYDHSYSFEKNCVRTTVFTDSNGVQKKTQSSACYAVRSAVKEPTCSQAGEEAVVCVACAQKSEIQASDPLDHAWVKVREDHYYCFICGLENSKGASGDIIMEDLTNDTHYVVGYAVRNHVSFTHYVSLVLANGDEIIAKEITLIQLEDACAFAFSKAEVEAWAAANGYTDYVVRFTFVPVGADGSFDYSITFAETDECVQLGVITGNVSFTAYIPNNAPKSFTITPTEDGIWTFISAGGKDPYANLYDHEGKWIGGDDDGGDNMNFKITYELKAGQTYTIQIGNYRVDDSYVNLVFTWVPLQ